VASNNDQYNYKKYHENYAVPIKVTNYEAGDVVTISVTYSWNAGDSTDNIPRDYSLSVYSRQLLFIKDSEDKWNQLFGDGRLPS